MLNLQAHKMTGVRCKIKPNECTCSADVYCTQCPGPLSLSSSLRSDAEQQLWHLSAIRKSIIVKRMSQQGICSHRGAASGRREATILRPFHLAIPKVQTCSCACSLQTFTS